jgi:hypothetical protein
MSEKNKWQQAEAQLLFSSCRSRQSCHPVNSIQQQEKMQRAKRIYKPGFVPRSCERGDDHSSTTTVACAPLAAYPEVVTSRTDSAPCLALRRAGFTEPGESPRLLVRSYRTVSPLPEGSCELWALSHEK